MLHAALVRIGGGGGERDDLSLSSCVPTAVPAPGPPKSHAASVQSHVRVSNASNHAGRSAARRDPDALVPLRRPHASIDGRVGGLGVDGVRSGARSVPTVPSSVDDMTLPRIIASCVDDESVARPTPAAARAGCSSLPHDWRVHSHDAVRGDRPAGQRSVGVSRGHFASHTVSPIRCEAAEPPPLPRGSLAPLTRGGLSDGGGGGGRLVPATTSFAPVTGDAATAAAAAASPVAVTPPPMQGARSRAGSDGIRRSVSKSPLVAVPDDDNGRDRGRTSAAAVPPFHHRRASLSKDLHRVAPSELAHRLMEHIHSVDPASPMPPWRLGHEAPDSVTASSSESATASASDSIPFSSAAPTVPTSSNASATAAAVPSADHGHHGNRDGPRRVSTILRNVEELDSVFTRDDACLAGKSDVVVSLELLRRGMPPPPTTIPERFFQERIIPMYTAEAGGDAGAGNAASDIRWDPKSRQWKQ
jgi:hypothetical protein